MRVHHATISPPDVRRRHGHAEGDCGRLDAQQPWVRCNIISYLLSLFWPNIPPFS